MSEGSKKDEANEGFTEINLSEKKTKLHRAPSSSAPSKAASASASAPKAPAQAKSPFATPLATSDQTSASDDFIPPRKHWYKDPIVLSAFVLTILWGLVAFQYIIGTGWWANRFSLDPSEFVGLISGMFLPIVIIWLAVSYLKRSFDREKQAQMLESYMRKLVCPSEDEAVYTRALTEALRSQVSDLRDAFSLVNSASAEISTTLQQRLDEMRTLASKVDGEILFSIKDLATSVEGLLANADSASVRAKEASALLSDQVVTLNETSEEAGKRVTGLGQDLKISIEGIDALSKKIEEKGDLITNTVQLLEKKIETVGNNSEDIVRAAVVMSDDLTAKTTELVSLFRDHEAELSAKTDSISTEAANLSGSFKKQAVIISDEGEKISSRLRLIAEDISARTDKVISSADASITKLGEVAEIMASNTDMLSIASAKATSDMKDAGLFFEQTFSTIAGSSDAVVDKTTGFIHEVRARCDDIAAATDIACAKIAAVGESAAGQTLALKNTVEGVADGFASLITAVSAESAKLEELSSIVVSQTRLSETALAEQQKHISASAARIEEIKGELRKEVEEMTAAAKFIDENTATSTLNLRKNMEELLSLADLVIGRTGEVSTVISQGTKTLDTSSSAALNTVNQVAVALKAEGETMADISKNLEAKVADIAEIIAHQTETAVNSSKYIASYTDKALQDMSAQGELLQKMTTTAEAKILKTSENLEEKASYLADMLTKTEDFIRIKSESMLGTADSVGAAIAKHTEVIDTGLDKAAAKLTSIERAFADQLQEIGDGYDAILAKIEKASTLVKSSQTAFDEASGKASSKAALVAKDIDNISENALKRAAGIADIMEQISEEVDNLSAKSSTTVESAAKNIKKILSGLTEGSNAAAADVLAAGEAFIRRAEMINQSASNAAEKLKALIAEVK